MVSKLIPAEWTRAFLVLWWILGVATGTGGVVGSGIALWLIGVTVAEVGDVWESEII